MARRTTRAARWAAAAALLAAAIAPARAEPYIALRTGMQCSACHVNQTGGGQRNAVGVAYGLETLPARPLSLPEGMTPFDGSIGTHLAVGADFRGDNEGRYAASGNSNTFATGEGNLYADARLVPDRLSLYADLGVAPGAAETREIFVLASHLPGQFYLKAGRFFAPYGWRLQDDEAFIRARTGFNFHAPDDGVEVGWQPGDVSASLAVTNGNGGAADDNTSKRVSLITTWARPRFRLGGSFSSNHQGPVQSLLGGLLAGVKLGRRLVALGEVDAGRDEDDTTGVTTRRRLAYGEADLLLGAGINLKAAFDYEDPDASARGDEVNRVSLGFEDVVTQYVQLRLLWRRTDRPPVVHQTLFEDDQQVIAELHLFL